MNQILRLLVAVMPTRGRLKRMAAGCLLVLAAGGPTGAIADIAKTDLSVDDAVVMARATWDTGWFQAEVFRYLLQELGYSVEEPRTMDNRAFYQAAARGDVDLWANGWFPSHQSFLTSPQIGEQLAAVGFEVKAGALQGYLVDKRSAEALGIEGLSDFKDPRVAAQFDRNGDGKADLVGCNVGWGCEMVVEHHLDALDLWATVQHVQGDYSPMMDDTIKRYKRGESVLFYTWTPNWTVGTLVPGRDVVWIQVPSAAWPPEDQADRRPPVVDDVPGCAGNPCNMGFPPNDIRVVANKHFLDGHPDIRRLLELVTIPLQDISRQNARMLRGEDAYEDIRRHAREWIDRNRHRVDGWLQAAKSLQAEIRKPAVSEPETRSQRDVLRVATQRSEPFVIYQNKAYVGFSIELWEKIAQELDLGYEIYGVNTIAKLLDEVKRGAADLAISGIGITSRREQALDFSHSFYESGLQIMVPSGSESIVSGIVAGVLAVVFSRELIYGVVIFFLVLLLAAHVIWILERRHNPEFPRHYPQGIWQSIWWAVVTVTTVGYGDKTPKGNTGRLFGLVWILAGYFVFAYFTASVTSTVTVQELFGTINGPEDLFGKRVATVEKSTAAEYLRAQGVTTIAVQTVDKAYRLLEAGKADAVVYDAPVLQHYASQQGKGRVRVVGLIFEEKSYGIALQVDSPYRDDINIALLKIMEEGTYERLREKWFGS